MRSLPLPSPVLRAVLRKEDQQLACRIASVFEKELADTDLSGIRFFVRNGCVEIRGMVGSEADQRLLGSIVERIPGVKTVDNQACAVRTRIYYLARRKAS